MKKLLLILLCFPLIGFGQVTMIPDANFEQALINLGYDTGPPNGSVPTANINTVTYLYLGYQNISDLTGIEDFADLYSFYCNNNQLLTLDLSSNSVLYRLDCSYNQLSTLSLTGNSNLELLNCGNNQLSNLDVNANLLLRNLNAPANSLSNINLINNISLTSLGLGNNQLTTLNLDNNISLEHLNIVNNQVSILNLIYSVSLTDIWISNNNIGALDISNSPNLWVIWGPNNQITTLDVSNNTILTQLYCTDNLLTSLDVRNGNNSSMNVFSTTGNPNLTCINVDNPVYSSANWTSIDPQHYFSMSCPVLGCTDPLACNYDFTATVDDGSCVYPTTSTTTITACDTYTWNGTTYTTSGTYVNTITAGQTPQVGNFVEGGVVFWVDPNNNTKGLVCDVNDLTPSEWGCFQISVSGADGTAIGTGAQNTIDIVAANCSPFNSGNTIAANECASSTSAGYSDWFLPSKDALNQMDVNKAAINATAATNSGSAFTTTSYYWSSSEESSTYAWFQYFANGNQNYHLKKTLLHVRAVRAYTVTIGTCDSTATLDLTINNSTTSTDVQTACDTYTWLDGVTYTASNNTATFTTTNAAGCDSVITLDLTINQSATSTTTISACDTYTWNGTTYTTSGTYVETITAVQTPQIGDFIEGGVVFWIDPTDNTKGLVCDVNDLANSEWGCLGTNIAGADGILIGTGAQNTIDIVNANCSPNTLGNTIAANECANSTSAGYSDWFLPSRDELLEIRVNLAVVEATVITNGGSAFTTNYYWSSSEVSGSGANMSNFISSHGSSIKYATHNVRAVRAYTVMIGTCDSIATLNLTITSCLCTSIADPGFENTSNMATLLDWEISHGSPSVGPPGYMGNNLLHMWAHNQATAPQGEGVYTCFNFDATKCYDITFYAYVEDSSLIATFELAQSSSLTPNTLGGFIPTVSSISIASIPFSGMGANWSQITIQGYQPSQNDDQFWIYPLYTNGTGVAKIWIDEIHITEVPCNSPCVLNLSYTTQCYYPTIFGIPFSFGGIDLTVSGGSGSYSYYWIGPNNYISTDEDITGLDDGTYTVGVSDLINTNCANYWLSVTVACDTCNSPVPTGLSVTDLTHDRARINWDNMNTASCMVEMYRVQYKELGTIIWSTKTILGSGLCNSGLTTTSKMLWNLPPSTTYLYRVKAWYCLSSASPWSSISTFTTAPVCENVSNLVVTSGFRNPNKAYATWTPPASGYISVQLQYREVQQVGSNAPWLWFKFNKLYGTFSHNRYNLNSGIFYQIRSRTVCASLPTSYKSAWSSSTQWSQQRIAQENYLIQNLDMYPNPTTGEFYVNFQSEEIQNIEVKLTNTIGEIIYFEDLGVFVGEYTHRFNISEYPKGIYFLEITTDKGVINKKLILQ